MFERIWEKLVNRETISYFIFGVLTTAVDWVVYMVIRGFDYRVATALGWCASVLFAFVTNKIFVFQSRTLEPGKLLREFVSFVACRGFTFVFNMAGMIVMVSYLAINDIVGKIFLSAIVLILNYVFSKLFIFRDKTYKGE